MLPKEYGTGSIVILIIGSAYLIDMITGSCSQILMCSPHYKFGLYFSIVLVILTVVLNYLLIPIYGIVGAAIATATAIFLTNVSKVIFLWYKLKMQPLNINALYIAILGGIILILSYFMDPFDNFYLDIIVRSLLISSIYLSLIWALKLSKEFNQAVGEIFKKIIN
jgi:O-antigen/teichoic acid export membrane protein